MQQQDSSVTHWFVNPRGASAMFRQSGLPTPKPVQYYINQEQKHRQKEHEQEQLQINSVPSRASPGTILHTLIERRLEAEKILSQQAARLKSIQVEHGSNAYLGKRKTPPTCVEAISRDSCPRPSSEVWPSNWKRVGRDDDEEIRRKIHRKQNSVRNVRDSSTGYYLYYSNGTDVDADRFGCIECLGLFRTKQAWQYHLSVRKSTRCLPAPMFCKFQGDPDLYSITWK